MIFFWVNLLPFYYEANVRLFIKVSPHHLNYHFCVFLLFLCNSCFCLGLRLPILVFALPLPLPLPPALVFGVPLPSRHSICLCLPHFVFANTYASPPLSLFGLWLLTFIFAFAFALMPYSLFCPCLPTLVFAFALALQPLSLPLPLLFPSRLSACLCRCLQFFVLSFAFPSFHSSS